MLAGLGTCRRLWWATCPSATSLLRSTTSGQVSSGESWYTLHNQIKVNTNAWITWMLLNFQLFTSQMWDQCIEIFYSRLPQVEVAFELELLGDFHKLTNKKLKHTREELKCSYFTMKIINILSVLQKFFLKMNWFTHKNSPLWFLQIDWSLSFKVWGLVQFAHINCGL